MRVIDWLELTKKLEDCWPPQDSELVTASELSEIGAKLREAVDKLRTDEIEADDVIHVRDTAARVW